MAIFHIVLFFLLFITIQVRVDVSARNPGKVQAALTENRRGLTELVLEPLREEQYYEVELEFMSHISSFATVVVVQFRNNWLRNFCSLSSFVSDKGTLQHNVSFEESNGFDGGIHGDCDVPNAKTCRKYGYVLYT